MKERLELPVGIKVKICIANEFVPFQVVASGRCADCALNGTDDIVCDAIECRGSFRSDKTGIILKQLKNTKKTKK